MNKPPISRTCEWCGRGFLAHYDPRYRSYSIARTCSRTCRHRLGSSHRQDQDRCFGHPWTSDELNELIFLTGSHLPEFLWRNYNKWARANGYPVRSRNAVLDRARSLVGSNRPLDDGWTTGQLSELIGASATCIRTWVRLGYLTCLTTRKSGRRSFRRRDLRRLARTRPQLLGGANEENLAFVLDDPDLARQICQRFRRKSNAARPVVRLCDGRVWPSATAAAREVYVSASCLQRAARRGMPVDGHYYVYEADLINRPDHCDALRLKEASHARSA